MYSKKFSIHIIHLFLAISMILSLFVPVSTVSAEESEATENEWGYFMYIYDNSNGLPTSEANAVAQMGIGFIWIGGYSGLTRYDGNEFKHFDASAGVASVNCIYLDSNDRMWIGTNDSGVALRQYAEFQFWGKDEGLDSLSVRAICEDGAGNIIIATTEGMAYIDNNNELHDIDDSNIEDKYVRCLTADADGVIYGSTMDSCFFSMENLEVTSFYDAKEMDIGEVICITADIDKKGMVYLGTQSSEIIYGNMMDGMKNSKILSAAPQEHINDIYIASDNKIWITSNNGLGYFDENRKYVELKNSPMNSSITSITEDREGNMWCTSSRQGVMKVVKSPFIDITGVAGLERVVTNTTCIYQGDLYIGTDAGLQLVDKDYNPKENVLTELLKGIRIRSIKADSAGNLWLCTYSNSSDYGLVCYHGDGTYEIFNEASGLVSGKIRTLTEMSDGTIAVAASGGVNLIKDGKVIDTYNTDDGVVNTEILCITEGENGSIYFGSDGGGLYIMEDGELRCLGLDDGLRSQVITQINKDPIRDVYWIITSNSIAYMKNEEIHTLSNFPYSDNYDIQFDVNGGIWILSSNGIYFVNGDSLISDEELIYSYYDIRSGLPSIATSNSRNYISPDGTLYIAGISGVSSININSAREGKNDVKLVVPFIEIDNQEIFVSEGETIVIPSDCKRLTIHGIAMTYAYDPQVSYYVEGFDDEPTIIAKHEMKPLSYTRPHSGEYVFHMSIVDVMTGEEVNTIGVKIIVEKALYEKLWFWALIAVAVTLIIIAIVHLYVQNKLAKVREQEKKDRTFIRELIHVFVKSIEVKDKYTNGHSMRVAEYTKMIAERAGYSEDEAERFYNIGLMHDIGKVHVPDEVLNKPGRLTDEEFAIMKKHPSDGYEILKEVEILPELAWGAGYHHERVDGKGYPFGKSADEIPDVALIIAVADTFDAMHSTRPYRKKMKMEDIVAELKRVSGTQLSEKYVQVLLTLIEEGKFDK